MLVPNMRDFLHTVMKTYLNFGSQIYMRQWLKLPRNLIRLLNSRNMAAVAEKKKFQRLSRSIIPMHYALMLKPDLVDLTFQGSVSIQIEVR